MTWEYELTADGDLSVYDHNGDPVTTRQNDGSGFTIPDEVLEIIGVELNNQGWDITDPWVQETMKTALVEDIERR